MHVNISNTGGWGPFTMRTDQKPFDDVRVRQAFRLIVNRKEMLDQVFGGQGQVGNDVFSILDKSYPKDLPQREQDIDQAKSLLKAAGAENLTVDLVTTPNAPGMVQAAQVLRHSGQEGGRERQRGAADHDRLLRQFVFEGAVQSGLLADRDLHVHRGAGVRRRRRRSMG